MLQLLSYRLKVTVTADLTGIGDGQISTRNKWIVVL